MPPSRAAAPPTACSIRHVARALGSHHSIRPHRRLGCVDSACNGCRNRHPTHGRTRQHGQKESMTYPRDRFEKGLSKAIIAVSRAFPLLLAQIVALGAGEGLLIGRLSVNGNHAQVVEAPASLPPNYASRRTTITMASRRPPQSRTTLCGRTTRIRTPIWRWTIS
jgi:hypothetical protein